MAEQWTTDDVAAHLGVSASTVRAYASRGQMPPPDGRIGRTPWWWADRIWEWSTSRRRGSGRQTRPSPNQQQSGHVDGQADDRGETP